MLCNGDWQVKSTHAQVDGRPLSAFVRGVLGMDWRVWFGLVAPERPPSHSTQPHKALLPLPLLVPSGVIVYSQGIAMTMIIVTVMRKRLMMVTKVTELGE